MSGYSSDRAYSDLFIPAIQQIVGPYLIVPADLKADIYQATDMTILTARDITVACRIRRPGYLDSYGWEFTIRSLRDSGTKTELAKIVEGWGDWMFYAHAKSDGLKDGFARWFLIDLSAWRAHMIRRDKRIRWGETPNGDGTHFRWFDLRTFPPDPPILIASSDAIPVLLNEPTPANNKTQDKPTGPLPASLFNDPILAAIDR